MNITDRQRAHAKRNATQDAPRYAKGRTVTPEKISTYTEYQATIAGAPKTEPALTQWKEIYRDTMTAYMINANHLSPEHEQQERDRLDPPPAPKIQVTKDGPAYLLPGVDPAPRKRGDADQLTMF